jgi:quinol monooxygenase YgiN
MITVLTTYRIQRGRERDFELAFRGLQARVIGDEPGTVAYQLYRSAEDKRTYKVIAHFRDEAAMQAHAEGRFLKAAAAQIYAACEKSPEAEVFYAT